MSSLLRPGTTALRYVPPAAPSSSAQTPQWVATQDWLLDFVLHHFTLGRPALYEAILGRARLCEPQQLRTIRKQRVLRTRSSLPTPLRVTDPRSHGFFRP